MPDNTRKLNKDMQREFPDAPKLPSPGLELESPQDMYEGGGLDGWPTTPASFGPEVMKALFLPALKKTTAVRKSLPSDVVNWHERNASNFVNVRNIAEDLHLNNFISKEQYKTLLEINKESPWKARELLYQIYKDTQNLEPLSKSLMELPNNKVNSQFMETYRDMLSGKYKSLNEAEPIKRAIILNKAYDADPLVPIAINPKLNAAGTYVSFDAMPPPIDPSPTAKQYTYKTKPGYIELKYPADEAPFTTLHENTHALSDIMHNEQLMRPKHRKLNAATLEEEAIRRQLMDAVNIPQTESDTYRKALNWWDLTELPLMPPKELRTR